MKKYYGLSVSKEDYLFLKNIFYNTKIKIRVEHGADVLYVLTQYIDGKHWQYITCNIHQYINSLKNKMEAWHDKK